MRKNSVRLLTAMNIKVAVYWDVTQCNLVEEY